MYDTLWLHAHASFLPRWVVNGSLPRVRFKDRYGAVHQMVLADVHLSVLADVQPWRSFHWRPNQKHFPGWHWCSKTGDHVGYESGLERDRLILADFDDTVTTIKSQPFQLQHKVDGRLRRQTPDFLLTHSDGAVTVVNVKNPAALTRAETRARLAEVADTIQARGWRHELWTGAPHDLMANLHLLAGRARPWLFPPHLVDRVLALADGRTFGEVVFLASLDTDPRRVKPVLHHLLWTRQLTTDLTVELNSDSVLRVAR